MFINRRFSLRSSGQRFIQSTRLYGLSLLGPVKMEVYCQVIDPWPSNPVEEQELAAGLYK